MYRCPYYIVALASLMLAISARADDIEQRENQFKAAYLFNFMKFVDWPTEGVFETFTVCFLGGDAVHAAFIDNLDAKRVGTHKLAARLLQPRASLDDCHVLYIDAKSAGRAITTNQATLTVSDTPNFALHGGMIELFTDNHRLRFMVNVGNAHKAGLRISSELLKLAAGVEEEAQ